MITTNLEHPNEEALERYLLSRSEDQEVEVLETHILACEKCILRLETLESQIINLKTALAGLDQEQIQRALNPGRRTWTSWLTVPTLSWASAAAVTFMVGLAVIPHSGEHNPQLVPTNPLAAAGELAACDGSDANLSACRGNKTPSFPGDRPLVLRLSTTDIPKGSVDVQVVSGLGAEVWQGQATVSEERAEVRLPRIAQPGPYFLRLYTRTSGTRELAREFRMEIK